MLAVRVSDFDVDRFSWLDRLLCGWRQPIVLGLDRFSWRVAFDLLGGAILVLVDLLRLVRAADAKRLAIIENFVFKRTLRNR